MSRAWFVYRWMPMGEYNSTISDVWAAIGEDADVGRPMPLPESLRGHPPDEVFLRYVRQYAPDQRGAEREAAEYLSDLQRGKTCCWRPGPYLGWWIAYPFEKIEYISAGDADAEVDEEAEAPDERSGSAEVRGITYTLAFSWHVMPVAEAGAVFREVQETGPSPRRWGGVSSGTEAEVREQMTREIREFKKSWAGRVRRRFKRSALASYDELLTVWRTL